METFLVRHKEAEDVKGDAPELKLPMGYKGLSFLAQGN